MTDRSIFRRVLAALLVAPVLTIAVSMAPASARASSPRASVAAPGDPASSALDWLERELSSNGNAMPSSFGGNDWGLTIDSVLALAAGQRGTGQVASDATSNVVANMATEYFTGASFGSPDDRYAGPAAKGLLLAEVQGVATADIGGFDLETLVRSLMRTTGDEAGRFSDISTFGDFSNGFGQSLAILALSRTDAGVPSAALSFLLDQQCPAGGFRLFYAPTDGDPAGCVDDAEADTDATSLAIEALASAPHTPNTSAASTLAASWLTGRQGQDGGVVGTGPTATENAGSTGFAATAFRTAGNTAAADAAASWITSVQLVETDPQQSAAAADAGAIANDAATRDLAVSAGIDPSGRDSFRRATSQGVLALGLDGYDLIGGHVPVILQAHGSASATTAAPGDTITVNASGFLSDEAVTAVLHSTPITVGTQPAAGGAVSFPVALPADLEPGPHTVEMTGSVSGLTADVTVDVSAGATTPTDAADAANGGAVTSDSGLARTGSDNGQLLLAAGLCGALGALSLIASKRLRGKRAT